MKKERLASLLMTGVIMASTVVSASAMQFPQDVYYPSDDTGLAQKVYMVAVSYTHLTLPTIA